MPYPLIAKSTPQSVVASEHRHRCKTYRPPGHIHTYAPAEDMPLRATGVPQVYDGGRFDLENPATLRSFRIRCLCHDWQMSDVRSHCPRCAQKMIRSSRMPAPPYFQREKCGEHDYAQLYRCGNQSCRIVFAILIKKGSR